jgi:uncharacterized protein YigA (DUF484 family)
LLAELSVSHSQAVKIALIRIPPPIRVAINPPPETTHFMTQLPDANAVALFLQEYPDFFEHNPDLIAGLRLTTALGGRTVSLQERQVEVLRDKIRQLELKLASLTRNAGSNDVIMSNFHEWILRLLSQDTSVDLAIPLLQALKESFDVPEATLRLWDVKSDYADEWFNLDDIDVRLFADKQPTPVCGPAAGQPGVLWLDDAASMQSVALVPLRKPGRQHSFGLMVLGSPDPQRFAAELATDFLARIGETASARLQQLLA